MENYRLASCRPSGLNSRRGCCLYNILDILHKAMLRSARREVESGKEKKGKTRCESGQEVSPALMKRASPRRSPPALACRSRLPGCGSAAPAASLAPDAPQQPGRERGEGFCIRSPLLPPPGCSVRPPVGQRRADMQRVCVSVCFCLDNTQLHTDNTSAYIYTLYFRKCKLAFE